MDRTGRSSRQPAWAYQPVIDPICHRLACRGLVSSLSWLMLLPPGLRARGFCHRGGAGSEAFGPLENLS